MGETEPERIKVEKQSYFERVLLEEPEDLDRSLNLPHGSKIDFYAIETDELAEVVYGTELGSASRNAGLNFEEHDFGLRHTTVRQAMSGLYDEVLSDDSAMERYLAEDGNVLLVELQSEGSDVAEIDHTDLAHVSSDGKIPYTDFRSDGQTTEEEIAEVTEFFSEDDLDRYVYLPHNSVLAVYGVTVEDDGKRADQIVSKKFFSRSRGWDNLEELIRATVQDPPVGRSVEDEFEEYLERMGEDASLAVIIRSEGDPRAGVYGEVVSQYRLEGDSVHNVLRELLDEDAQTQA